MSPPGPRQEDREIRGTATPPPGPRPGGPGNPGPPPRRWDRARRTEIRGTAAPPGPRPGGQEIRGDRHPAALDQRPGGRESVGTLPPPPPGPPVRPGIRGERRFRFSSGLLSMDELERRRCRSLKLRFQANF